MLEGFKLHPAFPLHVLAMSVAFVAPQATVAKPDVSKLQDISKGFSCCISIRGKVFAWPF